MSSETGINHVVPTWRHVLEVVQDEEPDNLCSDERGGGASSPSATVLNRRNGFALQLGPIGF
jgi:hypothetical protein